MESAVPVLVEVEWKVELPDQASLKQPRLLDCDPADPGMAAHPLRQHILPITEGEATPGSDPPKLNTQRFTQQAAQGQPERRPLGVSSEVVPQPSPYGLPAGDSAILGRLSRGDPNVEKETRAQPVTAVRGYLERNLIEVPRIDARRGWHRAWTLEYLVPTPQRVRVKELVHWFHTAILIRLWQSTNPNATGGVFVAPIH